MTVSHDCSLEDGSVDVVKSEEEEAWPGSRTKRCRFSSEDPEPPDPPAKKMFFLVECFMLTLELSG